MSDDEGGKLLDVPIDALRATLLTIASLTVTQRLYVLLSVMTAWGWYVYAPTPVTPWWIEWTSGMWLCATFATPPLILGGRASSALFSYVSRLVRLSTFGRKTLARFGFDDEKQTIPGTPQIGAAQQHQPPLERIADQVVPATREPGQT